MAESIHRLATGLAQRASTLGPASWRSEDFPIPIFAYGFPRWKRPIVEQCLAPREVRFFERGESLAAAQYLALWGVETVPKEVSPDCRVLRLEDGFLRSAGLGADLVRPISWVVDQSGIYYDSSCSSDLEAILANTDFDEAMLSRAAKLRQRIVDTGLTKYNVGAGRWLRPPGAARVILVAGQVESDASLKFGGAEGCSNVATLQRVRRENPSAFLVYKPHPDVVAGMRKRGAGEQDAAKWCDAVLAEINIGTLFEQVDEVHVQTSLAGFEALLRGKQVICHGQPFYSGWGLTNDLQPVMRRTRLLSIEQLIAGALILYPLYLGRGGQHLIEPEDALEILQALHRTTGGEEPWWRGLYRLVLRRFTGVR